MADQTTEERARDWIRWFSGGEGCVVFADDVTELTSVIRKAEDVAYEKAAEVSQRHGNMVIAKGIRALKNEE